MIEAVPDTVALDDAENKKCLVTSGVLKILRMEILALNTNSTSLSARIVMAWLLQTPDGRLP